MGFSLTPPSVKLEQAPCGSLRNVLRSQSQPLENMDVHTITLQVCSHVCESTVVSLSVCELSHTVVATEAIEDMQWLRNTGRSKG